MIVPKMVRIFYKEYGIEYQENLHDGADDNMAGFIICFSRKQRPLPGRPGAA